MPPNEPILSEFLTKEQLGTELGRNARTLDRWAVLGIGPPRTYVGRKALYKRPSVVRWLAAQERAAGHSTPPEPTQTADRRGAHRATVSGEPRSRTRRRMRDDIGRTSQ
jgi:hypothetical protein